MDHRGIVADVRAHVEDHGSCECGTGGSNHFREDPCLSTRLDQSTTAVVHRVDGECVQPPQNL